MYLEQLKSNENGLESFYSLVKIISFLENIDDIELIEQINNEIDLKPLKSFNPFMSTGDSTDKLKFFENSMTKNEYIKFTRMIDEYKTSDLLIRIASRKSHKLLTSCIDNTLDKYKENSEFINNKILEAIKENKINVADLDKDKVKDFLLSLPEIKFKVANNLIIDIEKLENFSSITSFIDKQKKIFIFNLLLIFSSKKSLSPFTMDILKIVCKKLALEVEYIDELFDAAQKVSNAIDYAEELIYE